MDYIESIRASQPLFLSVTLIIAVVGLLVWLRQDFEAAVDFKVEVPQQVRHDWKGQVLEKPAIKVRSALIRNRLVSH